MELVLFTTNFPMGSGESFLECEIRHLANNFSRVTIIPLAGSGIPGSRNIPGNVSCLPALLPVTLKEKLRIFLLAVFNRQPVSMYLSDFVTRKVYCRKSWLIHWLSISSIARAAMRSDTYRDLGRIITPGTIFYFYWGDKSATLCPSLKKKFPENRFIARFHGTDLYETKSPGYMPYRGVLLQHLDLAVFISSHGKDFLVARYPDISSRTLISRLGVSDQGDGAPSSDGVLRVLTCSNVVKIKQLHLMVEALKLVGFLVEWTHIGDGELLDNLKNLSSGLPANVVARFTGAIGNQGVMQYYREHPVDLFFNVSANEGIPVSIMEAISFGIPVIAPAVGGIPEIVAEKHGYLMPPVLQPREIADAMTRFFKLPVNEREEMRIAAKQHWRDHFNASVNYPGFCGKIKEICGDRTENI